MTRVFGGRRGRVALCLTAVVGLLSAVTVLAVTGSREPAAALKLLNGDAWLANASAGTASHVNGYTGKVDGQVGIGTAGDPFQIVERPNGAYALDLKTGRLVRLDSATLSAGQSTTPRLRGATSGLQIVTATNASWVIDTTSGIVQQVDPSTLAAIGPQIPLGAPTGRATSDDTGTLWVPVPAKGRVDAITASGQLTSHPFGHSGDQVQVADTSSGVWAVDATAGHAQSLTVPQAHPVSFPSVRGRGSPIVGADPSAPYVVVVENLTAASPGQAVRDTSQVLVINTTQSSLSSVTSPAAAPATQVVVSGDQAYLLDAAANQLQTVNLTRTNFQAPVAVPAGSNQLVSKDQLVFVNNSDSPQALVVNAAGHVTPITKYTPTLPAPNRARPGSQSPPSPAPPSNFGGGPVTPTPPSGNHYGFNPRPHGPSPLPSPGPSVPTIPRTPVVSTPAPPPVPTPTPPPPLTPPPTTTPPTTAPKPTTTPPTTQPPSVPSPPTITGVTAGFERVTVTWTPPAVSGGSPVTHYTLTAGSSTIQAPGTATSGVLPVAADGTTVCPKISATNSTGTSPAAGGTKCATTTSLGQVTGLTVKASGTSVTASWNRVAHATGYRVSVNGASARTVSAASYSFSGSAWSSYTVSVRATDGVGTGPWSSQGPAYTSGSARTLYECQYSYDHAIGDSGSSSCTPSATWSYVGVAPFKAFPGQSSIASEELCTGWDTPNGSNEYLLERAGTACTSVIPTNDPQNPPVIKMWVSSKNYSGLGLIQVCVYRGNQTGQVDTRDVWELWPPGQQPSGMSSNGSCFYTPR